MNFQITFFLCISCLRYPRKGKIRKCFGFKSRSFKVQEPGLQPFWSVSDPASPSAEVALAVVLLMPGPVRNSNALLCSPGNMFNLRLDF